ncbi:hypothetical protein Gasu2_20990 [Galdieria sulphuraria]|uniref:Uncharacterized protein n=1 Tax=Galdieria sulphuraria TaxID=130081 RepID=M2Y5U0_GALSU|nr:uncharacterized protein Gasu_15620 [Galdieria sulphuraria]EME31328.1 hypothetical protein Gasu_15620 [Galdieria sulphuraria]GJD07760.1 hypothetical protein Gasu2_20990 [Galdieria sulphuraria]|eukprot:XP_005707848.1 hypothetical protein Gasu_15620 [Galdieria sulphuraria]
MEQNKAVRRPFKQPRKITEPPERSFKRQSSTAMFTGQKTIRRRNLTTNVSQVEVASTRTTFNQGCHPLKMVSMKQAITPDHSDFFATSSKDTAGSCLEYIEDPPFNIPLDSLDNSSLWEDEWLGDADDFELLDVIALHGTKESAA